MKLSVRTVLAPTPQQHQQLQALQGMFIQACNAIAPTVVTHRCWNRVTLHHLTYRQLRDEFPRLGSQMACNAIYAVCRAARIVYQHPRSPFNLAALGRKPLPRMQFTAHSPVYFDRHTLSLRDGQVSLFTLDGRIKLELAIDDAMAQRFHQERVREIVLNSKSGQFGLSFVFGEDDATQGQRAAPQRQPDEAFPEHVLVQSPTDPRLPPAGTNPSTAAQA
jgi:hypothetical protein